MSMTITRLKQRKATFGSNGIIPNETTGLKGVAVAVARGVSPNFCEGNTSVDKGIPDFIKTVEEHESRIAEVTASTGIPVIHLSQKGNADGNFMRDVAIEDCGTVYLLNPALNNRKPEIADAMAELPKIFSDVRLWPGPAYATAEGGDFVFAGKQPKVLLKDGKIHTAEINLGLIDTYLVGISHGRGALERTNIVGLHVVQNTINKARKEKGIGPAQFLPVTVSGVLHLETGLTIVKASPQATVALHDPKMEELPKFVNELFAVETLPAEQGYGANVLHVNDTIFTAKEHPEAGKAAEIYAPMANHVPLKTEQTAMMDGSLTCDFILASPESLNSAYKKALRLE